jgi:hypothetical protein
MIHVLAELRAMGVAASCTDGGQLRLLADTGDVPAVAVELARTHKAALLALCRTPDGLPFPPEMIHCVHHWIDTAESDGRTRRFCSTCGRFGGFVLSDGTLTNELPPATTEGER